MHTDPEKKASLSRYFIHQSVMSQRGFSLPELMIGIVLMMMLLSVALGLLKAVSKTYLYTLRQTNSLATARRALDTGDPSPGMAWQVRKSSAVTALSATQLAVTTPAGQAALYQLSGQTLNLVTTKTVKLAGNVSSLVIGYYNLDASGHIMVSTSAALVALTSIQITCKQPGGDPASYYEVERIRNGP